MLAHRPRNWMLVGVYQSQSLNVVTSQHGFQNPADRAAIGRDNPIDDIPQPISQHCQPRDSHSTCGRTVRQHVGIPFPPRAARPSRRALDIIVGADAR